MTWVFEYASCHQTEIKHLETQGKDCVGAEQCTDLASIRQLFLERLYGSLRIEGGHCRHDPHQSVLSRHTNQNC